MLELLYTKSEWNPINVESWSDEIFYGKSGKHIDNMNYYVY